MRITPGQYDRRCAEFPTPINALAQNNPIVNKIIQEYGCGHIVTLQEALYQMIINLAQDSELRAKSLIELYSKSTFAPTIGHEPTEGP